MRVREEGIEAYAAGLSLQPTGPGPAKPAREIREREAAFWLTLDAINFGSGWFPTLRKRDGLSGYRTIASGLRERFDRHGPWSARELAQIETSELATVLGQHPDHELVELFAASLHDLGHHLEQERGGRFTSLVDIADGSAVALVEQLAGWECFADCSDYGAIQVPFLKRAQLAAADLHRAGVAHFSDLHRLTMFADNLVPHVLRLDGVLHFASHLVRRIDAGALIEHGSPEEIEIRACALHAVELIVAGQPDARAFEVDELLWLRGQEPRYKASLRHRSRCTAY